MIEKIAAERFVRPKNDLHRRKLRALDNFVAGLLSRPERAQVGRVVLFGSTLEGDVTAESDVDLLVLGTGDLQTLRRTCAGLAFETGLATGESVEPLVFPLSYYYHPASPFIHRLRRRGKEILTMSEHNLKRILLAGKHRLAADYSRVARYVCDNGDYREAADLAYNAAETAVKGLLLLELDELPRSHGGLVNRFGDLYARTGKVPAQMGRDLHLALETRARARYVEDTNINQADAEEVIALAKALLERLVQFEQELESTDEEKSQ
ncbi:MAG: HEPN domain-containing protein [Anaerolineae bacterium]|nr:HEPN domain-containing protein [Anaerolineae bacterium]